MPVNCVLYSVPVAALRALEAVLNPCSHVYTPWKGFADPAGTMMPWLASVSKRVDQLLVPLLIRCAGFQAVVLLALLFDLDVEKLSTRWCLDDRW